MPLYLVRLKPGHEMEWGGMFQADTPADLIDLVGEEVHPRFYLYKEIQSPLGVMLPLYEFDLDDETKVVTGSTEDTFRMSGGLYDEFNDSDGWDDLELVWLDNMSHGMKAMLEMAENMPPGRVIHMGGRQQGRMSAERFKHLYQGDFNAIRVTERDGEIVFDGITAEDMLLDVEVGSFQNIRIIESRGPASALCDLMPGLTDFIPPQNIEAWGKGTTAKRDYLKNQRRLNRQAGQSAKGARR